MGCSIDFSALPILTGCPGDGELFLVGNAIGGLDANGGQTVGYARRGWLSIKECVWSSIEGSGLLMFTGDQLNGSNQYFPVSGNPWLGFNLIVYYQGQGFLVYNSSAPSWPSSGWKPVTSGGGIAGIEILIPGSFTIADIFLVIPNGPQTF